MAQPSAHLKAFVKLGKFLGEFCQNPTDTKNNKATELHKTLETAKARNGWFTHDNLIFCLKQWSICLTEQNLLEWLKSYETKDDKSVKTIAVIMAGNIPLVGFHDFLTVLLSGNKVLAKLSDSDKTLLPFFCELLIGFDEDLKEKIELTSGKLESFDAVIATGSNNTSRYFEYYFGKHPNIIRKNRSSVAVLKGTESDSELKALGEDIFRYFGLGCRSVSKVFVPIGYDFGQLIEAISHWNVLLDNNKYVNNYDYNKAVYLMSDFKFLDSGFLLLKEDEQFSSPIATLNFSHYDTEDQLRYAFT